MGMGECGSAARLSPQAKAWRGYFPLIFGFIDDDYQGERKYGHMGGMSTEENVCQHISASDSHLQTYWTTQIEWGESEGHLSRGCLSICTGTLCVVYMPAISAMVSHILHVPGQMCKMEFSGTAFPTQGTFILATPDHGLAVEGTSVKKSPLPYTAFGKKKIWGK